MHRLDGIQPHFQEPGVKYFRKLQRQGIVTDQHHILLAERFGPGGFQPPDQRIGVSVKMSICQHRVSII